MLLRILVPHRDFADHGIFAGIQRLVQRHGAVGLPLAQLHQRFVHCDAHDPGIELRIALKIGAGARKPFRKVSCRTSSASSSFCVMCLASRKILLRVLIDQLVVRRGIALARLGNQRAIVEELPVSVSSAGIPVMIR